MRRLARYALITEASGTAKLAARAAGVQPVPLPRSAAGNADRSVTPGPNVVLAALPWAPEHHILAELLNRPPWIRDALCRERPSLHFIPDRGEPTAPLRAVCGACLVRSECLTYALADEDLAGVWGGTTAQERRTLRTTGRVA